MALTQSDKTFKQYRDEILDEIGVMLKDDRFPPSLLYNWVQADILATVLRLGSLVNAYYRKVSIGTLVVASDAFGQYCDISSLDMIHFPVDPIWNVFHSTNKTIRQIPIDDLKEIDQISSYDSSVYYALVQKKIRFAKGDSATLTDTDTLDIGYYVIPTKCTAVTDEIDLPDEWHDLAQQRTAVRILKRLGYDDQSKRQQAQFVEQDLNNRLKELEVTGPKIPQMDRLSGERR